MEIMKKKRISYSEKGQFASKQSRQVGQSKRTTVVTVPKLKKRNISVSMLKTRGNKEQPEARKATGEKLEK